MTRTASVFLLLCLASTCFGATILYVSERSTSVQLVNWLSNRGHSVWAYSNIANGDIGSYLSTFYDMTIYQNPQGVGWNSNYQSAIENYVASGGVFLVVGRNAITDFATTFNFATLGVGAGSDTTAVNSMNEAIPSGLTNCNILVNGYRYDLRGRIPSSDYPNWVQNHLTNMDTTYSNDVNTQVCLPNSQFAGYGFWTSRAVGTGFIVWMSTSSQTLGEFYKMGFYQAAFINLIAFASNGIIFGDPHVVTLERQSFDMPPETAQNYFNFYTTNAVSVNGFVETQEEFWGGVWVTEIGVTFTEGDVTHRLHAYFDDDYVFRFELDDVELTEESSGSMWNYYLDNEVVIGDWRNYNEFSSPGLFKLIAEDGSHVMIQAVEWMNAPSFSVSAHEPNLGQIDGDLIKVSREVRGILQHPAETESRDLETAPDVFQYARDSLFA